MFQSLLTSFLIRIYARLSYSGCLKVGLQKKCMIGSLILSGNGMSGLGVKIKSSELNLRQ